MAGYMPFVIGALVAVCTACLFGCFSVGGVPGRSVPTSAGARQVSVAGMKEGLLAFSRRLGEMVPQQISGNSVVRRCVTEIPFDGGDYVTKLGALAPFTRTTIGMVLVIAGSLAIAASSRTT